MVENLAMVHEEYADNFAISSATALQASQSEDDTVVALCERYVEIQNEIDADFERYKRISADVNASMPLPDPSIVHGPESASLGIKAPSEGDYRHLHNVIDPNAISSALFYVEPSTVTIVEEAPGVRKIIEHDKPQPLSPKRQLKHDKLTDMLKRATEYFEEQNRRLRAALGTTEDDDERRTAERGDEQAELADTICGTPARTPQAILAKINLYRIDPEFFDYRGEKEGGLAESVFRDVEALLGNG